MSTIQSMPFAMPRAQAQPPAQPPAQPRAGAAVLAMKAALSTLVQRRNGARASARELYYAAHSLLRTLRRHLRDAA